MEKESVPGLDYLIELTQQADTVIKEQRGWVSNNGSNISFFDFLEQKNDLRALPEHIVGQDGLFRPLAALQKHEYFDSSGDIHERFEYLAGQLATVYELIDETLRINQQRFNLHEIEHIRRTFYNGLGVLEDWNKENESPSADLDTYLWIVLAHDLGNYARKQHALLGAYELVSLFPKLEKPSDSWEKIFLAVGLHEMSTLKPYVTAVTGKEEWQDMDHEERIHAYSSLM